MYSRETLGHWHFLFTAKQRLSSPMFCDCFIKSIIIKFKVIFLKRGLNTGCLFALNKEVKI